MAKHEHAIYPITSLTRAMASPIPKPRTTQVFIGERGAALGRGGGGGGGGGGTYGRVF
jgi:hypothetical protein